MNEYIKKQTFTQKDQERHDDNLRRVRIRSGWIFKKNRWYKPCPQCQKFKTLVNFRITYGLRYGPKCKVCEKINKNKSKWSRSEKK
jgi:hypothetical protein